jgi:hypothetical protein
MELEPILNPFYQTAAPRQSAAQQQLAAQQQETHCHHTQF